MRSTGVLAKSGFLFAKGALDFAGGTVVHINAAIAGLVGAYVIGKRTGYGREAIKPHNLTLTMVGASILWFGWFGFNAGSALEAGGVAAIAFVNTFLATAAAVVAWTFDGVDLQGQAFAAGCGFGRGGRSGRDHARRPASSASTARWPSAPSPACCACGA